MNTLLICGATGHVARQAEKRSPERTISSLGKTKHPVDRRAQAIQTVLT